MEARKRVWIPELILRPAQPALLFAFIPLPNSSCTASWQFRQRLCRRMYTTPYACNITTVVVSLGEQSETAVAHDGPML